MWMQLELAYLSSSLFLISFVGVILAAYRKHLLKRIRVRVNCWFCNEFTRVPFDERNCFYCPSCKQYNGFRSDGSYNRSIPEQYDELLNPQLLHSNGKRTTVTNGLCRLCNNNQQLKIYQLAHFVPMHEENYDIEIEHFQKQLEKAYKLCSKCDKVVKKTILKQNKWMLGLRILSARGKYPVTLKTPKLSPWRGIVYTCAIFLSSFAAYLIIYKYERSKSIIKSFYEKLYEHSGPLEQGLRFFRKTAFFKENYTLVISTGVLGLVVSTILALYFTRSRQKSHCHNTAVVTEHRTNPKPTSTPTNFNTSGALDSEYESFHEALTKKRRPKKARTTPVFGQGPVFENSLSKSPSPVSFKDLNGSFSSGRNVGSGWNRTFSPRQNNSFNSVHNETFSSIGNNTFNSAQSNTLSSGRNDTFNSLRNDTLYSARNDTFSSSRNDSKPQVFNDLDVCLSNLKLNSNYVRPQLLFARPPSLRNPWTGQSWHDEPLSRSSSQSSGVYSSVEFPASICGDECRSIVSEPLFKCTYVYKSQGGSAFSKYSNGRLDDEPRSLFEAKSPRTSLFM